MGLVSLIKWRLADTNGVKEEEYLTSIFNLLFIYLFIFFNLLFYFFNNKFVFYWCSICQHTE